LVVVLDERGDSWSTEQFAEKIEGWQHTGRDLVFVIGGADGLDPEFRDSADQRLSLSRMVMPHGLVRVVVVEQLYRAVTVIDGHPYHK
jgi:23S rRNA (pseudouridine1915-N3)-methyltransferase